VGLERGPLSLVNTTEELPERKSSGSGLETRDYGLGIRRAYHATPLYPQKLALTSPTSGGCSVGIFRSRTKATELLLLLLLLNTNSLKTTEVHVCVQLLIQFSEYLVMERECNKVVGS
jgi:hypothetical protein